MHKFKLYRCTCTVCNNRCHNLVMENMSYHNQSIKSPLNTPKNQHALNFVSSPSQHCISAPLIQFKERISQQQQKNSACSSHNGGSESRMELEVATANHAHRIVAMMREQIEISTNLYSKNMNKVLREQAKQISALSEKVKENECKLQEKESIIDTLRKQLISEFRQQLQHQQQQQLQQNKLKKAVKTQSNIFPDQFQHKLQAYNISFANIQQKVSQIHMANRQICNRQSSINKKMDILEKGAINTFAFRLAALSRKICCYLSAKQKDMQRIEFQLDQVIKEQCNGTKSMKILQKQTQSQLKANSGSSANSMHLTHSIPKFASMQLQRIHKDVQSFQEAINNFMRKQFRYQNHLIHKLNCNFGELEKGIISLQVIKNENVRVKQQHNQLVQRVKQTSLRNQLFLSQNPPLHQYSASFHHDTDNKNMNISDSYQYNVSNHFEQSTPSNRSAKINSQHIDQNPDPRNLSQNFSTVNTHSSDRINPLKATVQAFHCQNTHKHQHAPNSNKNTSRTELNQLQKFSDLEQSDSQQNSLQFSEQEEAIQFRLLNTIAQMQLQMPIHVQIDQTGYLKCCDSGMYLVDGNDDGFELSQGEIARFEEKGLIIVDESAL